jgi:hypothetical protein
VNTPQNKDKEPLITLFYYSSDLMFGGIFRNYLKHVGVGP